MADKLWNATYWADRLKETAEEAQPLMDKLLNIPHTPFTYEEQFQLREILMEYNSYAKLLHDDMHKPEPPKPTLLKKILRRT